jgi:GWxTD domain-containing protein
VDGTVAFVSAELQCTADKTLKKMRSQKNEIFDPPDYHFLSVARALRNLITSVFPIALFCILSAEAASAPQDDQALRQEEEDDYYEKWLRRDVIYIITDEERAVFESLTNDEEKERFIEQFWLQRDPDPTTALNEFQTEHYRRIAYANEHFESGFAGWQVDRGRVYILHGPPTEIERNPTGKQYERPMHEGGGSTMTYAFEVWRYREIPGIGTDIVLEFVDPSGTGEYRLATHPAEKDALLRVPGSGQTLAERMGLASRADHPYLAGGSSSDYPFMLQRYRDSPFRRYELYTEIQKPTEIKYKNLQEIVKINVSYSDLPIETHQDHFRLNAAQVLVPITFQVLNSDLPFKREGERWVARLAVYGLITSIANRLVSEFEDDLVVSYSEQDLERGRAERSVYQKTVTLDSKYRYKLALVVQDQHEQKTASTTTAIVPPSYSEDELQASSFILADMLQPLDKAPEQNEMFVLGDVKVRPRIGGRFNRDSPMGLYLQLYNAEIDQSTLEPSLEVTYRIVGRGKVLAEHVDRDGESTQFFSGQRVVLVKGLSLKGLNPGRYKIQVTVRDQLDQETLELTRDFEILDS